MHKYIDLEGMTLSEALEGIRIGLKEMFPGCSYRYFAVDHAGGMTNYITGGYGDRDEIEKAAAHCGLHDKMAGDMIVDAFMSIMISMDRHKFNTVAKKELYDAIVGFAEDTGISTEGLQRFYKKRLHHTTEAGGAIMMPDAIAARIEELKAELKQLEHGMSKESQLPILRAQLKRARKAGDAATMSDLEDKIWKLENEDRLKAEIKAKRLAGLAKARIVRAENRAKKLQADKDRQRGQQQFQPHGAAKRKMQKIRERQAERAASKKKGQEGREYSNRPISETIARYR